MGMSRDVCSGFLEALARLNDGCNHGTEYTFEALPEATSLDDSLESYFSSMSTSRVPPQSAAAWNIQTESLHGAWTAELEVALRRWFFAQEFSPMVDPDVASGVVACFLSHLRETVGDAKAYRVRVSPPMWYECVWEDYALDARGGRWLLHFGFSD
jgi:hypothetical protein